MGFQGHQARKRFGQHWLKDQMVLDRIVAAADLQSSDRVLEVGPGRGALTELLLASPAAAVHAVDVTSADPAGLYCYQKIIRPRYGRRLFNEFEGGRGD